MKYLLATILTVLTAIVLAYLFEPIIKTWPLPLCLGLGVFIGSCLETTYLIALDNSLN